MSRTQEQPLVPPSTSPPKGKVNVPLQQAIEAILADRPIAYHAVLARAVGSVTAGILLSQLLYWMPRSQDQEGWFWKTRDDIYEETALTRREQETARRVLTDAGILEEKLRGVPARMHFRVDMGKLVELVAAYTKHPAPTRLPPDTDEEVTPQLGGKRPTGWAESAQLDGRKAPNKSGGNSPTITETTTETTQREQQQATVLLSAPKVDPEPEASDVVDLSLDRTKRADAEPTSPDQLKGALIKRGMGASTAAALVRDIRPQLIREKLALFDWAKQHRPGLITRSDGGWLRTAIETNYPLPADFTAIGERDQQRQLAAERKVREQTEALAQKAREMADSPSAVAEQRLRVKDRLDDARRRPRLTGEEREHYRQTQEAQHADLAAQWFTENPSCAHLMPDWLHLKQDDGESSSEPSWKPLEDPFHGSDGRPR